MLKNLLFGVSLKSIVLLVFLHGYSCSSNIASSQDSSDQAGTLSEIGIAYQGTQIVNSYDGALSSSAPGNQPKVDWLRRNNVFWRAC